MPDRFELIEKLFRVMRYHCDDDQINRIIDELCEVKGSSEFRDNICHMARINRIWPREKQTHTSETKRRGWKPVKELINDPIVRDLLRDQ